MAEGRFVYVRSFESARMLRIDGIKVYRNPSVNGRQLEDLVSGEDEAVRLDAEKQHHDKYHISRMKRLKANMLNLTKSVCKDRIDDPPNAVKTRREAAILWAELDEETANSSCFDCVTLKAANCTVWFASKVGVRSDVGPKAQHVRMLREQLRNGEYERRRKLEDALEQVCCRTNKKTGERMCSKNYCHKAIEQSSRSRMGHILRRMHDKGHIEMSVEQRVAVDVISPHLHTDPRCRATDQNSKRVDPLVTDAECLASSMIAHIADKHGVSKTRIDEELGKYGLTVAQMIAQPLKVASTASGTIKNFKSNPAFADMAAKVKEKNRMVDEGRRKLRKTTRPHGRSLKNARDAVAEYKETEASVRSASSRTRTNHQKVKSSVHRYLRNVSEFTSSVNDAAAASRASSLMPVLHAPHRESISESTKNALAAIVSAEGSVVGTAVRSVGALSGVLAKSADLANQVHEAAKETQEKPLQRRLSQATLSMFYDEVEKRFAHDMARQNRTHGRRLAPDMVGLTLPEQHVRDNGWAVGIVDWKRLVQDVHQMAKVVLERQDARIQHVKDTGHLPSGSLKDAHMTGVGMFDLNAPPSALGNKLRELHSWMTNRHKSVERREDHRRRMEESRNAPRRSHDDSRQSVLGAAVEASVLGHDVFDSIWNTLETSSRYHASHSRKLADSFLGAAATVPLLSTSVENKYSSYKATDGGVNYFKETIRYLVYGKHSRTHELRPVKSLTRAGVCTDTALCYLYSPDATRNGGDFGDGTNIKTHRTDRMCFPMSASRAQTLTSTRTSHPTLGRVYSSFGAFENGRLQDSLQPRNFKL